MSRLLRFARLALAGTCVGLLGACASTFSAEVTRYQQWPDDAASAYYQVAAADWEKNNLQFQTYADMVRAAIGVTGLVEVQPGKEARFDVRMDYDSPLTRFWRQRPTDPAYLPGAVFEPYGPFGAAVRSWGGWGFGPPSQAVPMDLYRHTLTVTIQDRRQHGREVYRATAVSLGLSGNMTPVMPYLARAIFDRFPGHNAQVIEVEYPMGR